MIRRYVAVLIVLICCFYICLPLSAAQQTCCDKLEDYDDIGYRIYINVHAVKLNDSFWDLRANISWKAVDGYDRYEYEFEPYSASTGNNSDCNSSSCTLQGNTTDENEIAVYGLQFGSLYRFKVYFIKPGEVQRGPYATRSRNTPDCIYRTGSVAFCQEQAVQYVGQPFEIGVSTTGTPLDDDMEVPNYFIRWRQPVHINPETPLKYYELIYFEDGSVVNEIKLNISYESGGRVDTEFNNLRFYTYYKLEITPIVIGQDGSNIRGPTVSRGFDTSGPTIFTNEQDPDPVALALIISAAVIFAVASILVFAWLMYKESHNST
ncbi:uncharacterized protein [Antedon mediterranea]|uniref:uncharacterized protein n=1 Tax=Antedon mediterranea TaxID=105859 RepID=UPI003AF4C75C